MPTIQSYTFVHTFSKFTVNPMVLPHSALRFGTSMQLAHSQLEAFTEWGGPVQVEMSQDRFRELRLTKNDEFFIIPKEVKVFRDSA